MKFESALVMAVVLVSSGCPTTTKAKCSTSNCAGCCDVGGVCQTGSSIATCGTAGLSCVACASGQSCAQGFCAGGNGNDAGNTGDAGNTSDGGNPACVAGATITGTRVVHYVSAGGTVTDGPEDMSKNPSQVGAVARCSDGTYGHFPATGQSNGSFTIDGVPSGAYYLVLFGNSYTSTSSRSVDLGYYSLGRPDQQYVDAGTTLALTATGLLPYNQFVDDIQIFSAGAGLGYWSLVNGPGDWTSNGPDAGDIALNSAVLDYYASGFLFSRLIQSSKGDSATFTQLTWQTVPVITDGGSIDAGVVATYNGVTRAATTSSLEMADRINTAVPLGAMAAVPQTSLVADVAWSKFEGSAVQAHPLATVYESDIYLDVFPGSATWGNISGTPDLLWTISLPVGIVDQTLSLQYGNPYSSSWPPYLVLETDYQLIETLNFPDGGTGSRALFGSVATQNLLANFVGQVSPAITPVRNIQLNGLAATGNIVGVTTTPSVSWSAPSVGSPQAVYVFVYQLIPDPTGLVQSTYVGQVGTTASPVTLPAGILEAGGTYAIKVRAISDPSITHFTGAPFLFGPADSFADAFTGVLAP